MGRRVRLESFCFVVFIASYGVAAFFARHWGKTLPRDPPPGSLAVAVFDQAAGEEEAPTPAGAGFERRALPGGDYQLTYAFKNFNEDALSLSFQVSQKDLQASLDEFGYTDQGTKDIYRRYSTSGAAVYKQKLRQYLSSRGFRLMAGDVVTADIPLMVRRNHPRLNTVAQALDGAAAEKGYGSDEIIGAGTALVQTAVRYKIPPMVEDGRRTGGIHPPPKAFVDGWGDCDTKSALLASLLMNWDGMKVVGVSLPRHYLIGIARSPRKGDAYVEQEGIQYVLIEPAGPAWLPPGTVSQDTLEMLDSTNGVPIEPL